MKKLLLAIALISASSAVYAEKGVGPYLGAGVGLSNGYEEMDGTLGYKIFGGYQFTPNWAAELQVAGTSAEGSFTERTYGYTVKSDIELDASHIGAYAVWSSGPSALEVFAKLGLSINKVDATGTYTTSNSYYGTYTEKEDVDFNQQIGLGWGLGGTWNAHKNFALRAEYENFGKVAKDADDIPGLFSLSAIFKY